MTAAALCVDHVSVTFGGLKAVDDVSFEIAAGSITGIIGPNGAGKSTLLGALAGWVKATSGSVSLAGEDVTGRPLHQRCRAGLAATHQIPRPFPEMTVAENVAVAAEFGGGRAGAVQRAIELCDLDAKVGRAASSLRPSELRRLELGRALATSPRVLLVDEVAAGMPVNEVNDLVASLRRIQAEEITMLLVDHVMHALLPVAERLLVLDEGSVIADGAPRDVIREERVVTAYFGADWEKEIG